MGGVRRERGQASVELVVLLPVLLAFALGCWQAVVTGQAAWLADGAVRAAARADAVGRDPLRAARAVLPERLEHGLTLRRRRDAVELSIAVRSVVGGRRLITLRPRARFKGQGS